jgi:hypothetical protein
VQSVHTILAYAAVAAVGLAVAWSCILAVRARSGGRVFDRLQVVVVGLVLLAAAVGAALFASGARPADSLHLLYGGVAVVLIPLARSFRAGAVRRDSVLMLVAVVALGGVLFRLFSTG